MKTDKYTEAKLRHKDRAIIRATTPTRKYNELLGMKTPHRDTKGARGGAVGWGTAVQDRRFFIYVILSAALWP